MQYAGRILIVVAAAALLLGWPVFLYFDARPVFWFCVITGGGGLVLGLAHESAKKLWPWYRNTLRRHELEQRAHYEAQAELESERRKRGF